VDPETVHQIVARTGRYGPFVTAVLEEGSKEKPRTASLFKSMSLDTVTLDEALQLLSLPRVIGEKDGEEVTARNGRYGPYVQQGKESRSLESEEQLFSISLDDALALLAQPRQRRGGARQAAAPLKEVGTDPVSGNPIVVKSGRFGPYVTDGETNASLRQGDDPEEITLERATELLTERRARGPAKKPASRKPASRKRKA
jgi:DNA topoisomerase-1